MFGWTKRDKLEKNRRDGARAEEEFVREQRLNGKEIRRTGTGHDFKEVKRCWITGRIVGTVYHEIKHGNSKLSRRQKEARSRHGSKFVVHRYEPGIAGPIETSQERGKSRHHTFSLGTLTATGNVRNNTRRRSRRMGGLDPLKIGDFFGTSKPKKRSRKNLKGGRKSDPFGALIVPSHSKRKTRKKSTGTRKRKLDPFSMGGMFGSTPSTRRSSSKSSRRRCSGARSFSWDSTSGSRQGRKASWF